MNTAVLCAYTVCAPIPGVTFSFYLSRSLEGLPEEIVCELFDRVLACGRLTPSVLRTFKATGHETLLSFIRRAGIADDIPVQDYSFENSWLGYDRRV